MAMKKMKEKLKSRAGASMALALLLLMIVSVLTAVALSSAVTTVKRGKIRKDTQQTILTVQSAMVLLRDEFTDSTATVEETIQRTDGGNISGKTVTFEGRVAEESDDNPIRTKLRAAILEASNGRDSDMGQYDISAQVGDSNLDSVSVSLTMKGNGHIPEDSMQDYQITIYCVSADGSEEMSLVLDTNVKVETKSVDSDSYKQITTINWSPGGMEGD